MKKILVIDDSKIILHMVKNALKTKYSVIAAADGQNGLKYLEKNTCDLILLDYEMPGMDGMSVFIQLRGDPATAKIPVVFLTGNSDSETVSQVLALKPNGYIVKPVVPEELMKRVEAIIGS